MKETLKLSKLRMVFGLLAVVIIGVTAATGCTTVPKKLTQEDLQDPAVLRYAANRFWERNGVPDLQLSQYKKVVVTGFSVGFVTEKLEAVPQADGSEASGVQRVHIDYGPLEESLANELYGMFMRQLLTLGLEPVPEREILASPEYKMLNALPAGEAITAENPAYGCSSTGTIKQAKIIPGRGYGLVAEVEDSAVLEADRAIMRAFDADAAIRARFRVSVYEDCATIECGSMIWCATEDTVGELMSLEALQSEVQAVASKQAVAAPGAALELRVDTANYREAMQAIAPAYMSMAFDAGLRAQRIYNRRTLYKSCLCEE